MNVFLMHPNRDLDPKAPLPPNHTALIQDLELEAILRAMAQGDKFLYDTAKQALLTGLTDPDDIRYRQDILRDCLTHPSVVRAIYAIPIEATRRKQRHWMGIFTRYPAGVLNSAVEMLELFMELLHDLKRLADEHAGAFQSDGFRRFFAMIQRELSDDYFEEVAAHLRMLRFESGVLISAELGPGNEGTNYVLRKPNDAGGNWARRLFSKKSPSYSYTIHPRDDHGARALGELRDQGVNLVANAAGQSADHVDNFLKTLQQELAFYIGALNLSDALAALGMPVCFPQVFAIHERKHAFSGLYDPALALTAQKSVVGNEANANDKDLVMITGANQGGKSTFLRSIGQAQVMMQSGLFVAAQTFAANAASGVFTHYKREEDASMKSGKLDEELTRMSEIVNHVRPHALILFNESFAATNEREGSEIARQVVNALLERNIKVFFVTHQYELAHGYHAQNSPRHLFLRAGRQSDGSRTFKLREGIPLPTSYGEDVYRKVFGEGK